MKTGIVFLTGSMVLFLAGLSEFARADGVGGAHSHGVYVYDWPKSANVYRGHYSKAHHKQHKHRKHKDNWRRGDHYPSCRHGRSYASHAYYWSSEYGQYFKVKKTRRANGHHRDLLGPRRWCR